MAQTVAWHRKTFTRITAGIAVIIALTLAPVLLLDIAPSGTNWGKLSDVSQIYGASLSAVAVLGVAASLAYQARQTALANADAHRASHRELMIMTLNDPTLMVCWAPDFTALSIAEARQIIFANLIINDWLTEYRLKRLTEDALLVLFRSHFQGEVARKHWQLSSRSRREVSEAMGDVQGLRFVSIADKAFAQATTEGPAIPSSAYFSAYY
ncbi:DUF6082 family protein [Streptomyces sp. CA-106131]|uniref:DUF6082 family protein n=1 Tax=Streptomyces sp. CA-106131 TaxID=3240045 RepID=UPI003D92582E